MSESGMKFGILRDTMSCFDCHWLVTCTNPRELSWHRRTALYNNCQPNMRQYQKERRFLRLEMFSTLGIWHGLVATRYRLA